MVLGFLLTTWLGNLWPAIEFAFGPDHLRLEEVRRKRIFAFLAYIIVPLIPALIYDLVKYVVT